MWQSLLPKPAVDNCKVYEAHGGLAAPHSLQINGIIEHYVAVLKDMEMTMMTTVRLPKLTQNFLWPKAVKCAIIIYNITINSDNNKTPFK